MSQLDLQGSLEETVARLVQKAQQEREAKDLKSRVNRAKQNIQLLSRELRSLHRKVENLLFYDGVATEVFGDDRSANVADVLESIQDRADITDDQLIAAADEGDIRGLAEEIGDLGDSVSDAKASVINEIRDQQQTWEDEITAAQDLNQIVGGGSSGFDEVLGEMEAFIDEEIWNESSSPSTLASRWDQLTNQWEENSGRHGWDEFQQEHQLSDDSIDALRQFADRGSVQLEELSLPILEELKGVEELDSAIRLEIDTR